MSASILDTGHMTNGFSDIEKQSAKVKVSNKSRPSVADNGGSEGRATDKLQGRSVVRQKKADPLVAPIPVWEDGLGRPMGCGRQGEEQNTAALV